MNKKDQKVKKNSLKGLVDGFIYDKLEKTEYVITEKLATELLTWNRFDLGFKLAYLDNTQQCPELAEEVYTHDIKAQTLGKFIELGNEKNKQSITQYFEHFQLTYEDIKRNGFLKDKTLIPLSKDGTIINGAHRISSAIHLNEKVFTITTSSKAMVADYKYFFDRDVPAKYLELVAQKFIEYTPDNTYIAFLWPSGEGHKEKAENIFSNIVYKKNLTLTPKGGFNLLFELYKHMDWIGTKENNYKGIRQKLLECFPDFKEFQVIVFQNESLDKVQELKKQVRDIYNIGYSSIHITDTKEEAIRISKLLLNNNALHFLNNTQSHKLDDKMKELNEFKEFLDINNINHSDVVIDGSLTLSLYGLRENSDIDFLLSEKYNLKVNNSKFDEHDEELIFHKKSKNELIYNPENHFEFCGLKFVSFEQLYDMKSNRSGVKDKNDCAMMESLINDDLLSKYIAQLKQKVFYLKIKIKPQLAIFLKKIGLYKSIHFLYRKIKSKR